MFDSRVCGLTYVPITRRSGEVCWCGFTSAADRTVRSIPPLSENKAHAASRIHAHVRCARWLAAHASTHCTHIGTCASSRVFTFACRARFGRVRQTGICTHNLHASQSVSHSQYLRRSHEVVAVIRETFAYVQTHDRQTRVCGVSKCHVCNTIAHTPSHLGFGAAIAAFPSPVNVGPPSPKGKK